jgi:molybdate transport system substrate-binding protein
MLHRRAFAGLFVAPLLGWGGSTAAAPALTVFAAASLKDVLAEIGRLFETETTTPVTASLAGSGQLAKQIEAGAPADVFISADSVWMDWLAERHRIKPETRRDIAGNRLVLIAPAASQSTLSDLARLAETLGTDRLAIAQPDSVPAGRYAKDALTKLGLWDGLSAHLAATENVRAALLLVSRGEAPFGIVYASDAKADASVRVLLSFPDNTYGPIVYPAAVIAASTHPAAADFVAYLSSARAKAVFEKAGFLVPPLTR